MDLSGLFRDTAVVDVLMQSLLPAQSAALTVADVPGRSLRSIVSEDVTSCFLKTF